MKFVLICGLALLLSSCTDQQDSPVPPANEDQPEELLQVADDFESRADFLAAAYKKTKPQTTKVQDGKNRWTNPKNTSGQAPQVFPVDYNSRVYRKLMVLSLVNVLYDANRKTESYSRAKYWLNKFNSEYASELERAKFTDIHERTAEYFGRNVVHSVYHQYPVIQDYDGTNLASPLRTEARRCKKNITNGWNRRNRCL